jgi:DnaA family protein
MAEIAPQLPLNIGLRDDATFASHVASARSATARAAVADAGERLVYLHGPAEVGKSHLLQSACHAAAGAALYLPLPDLLEMDPQALLEDAGELPLVCVDDLQVVAGRADWERALFSLYNSLQAGSGRLLVAASGPPSTIGVELRDLRSRLSAMLVCALAPPDETERLEILLQRARQRGLLITPEVGRYILHRAERSLRGLIQVLDVLDRASLARQRAISIPFVRETLGW